MNILCTTQIDHLPDVKAALAALGEVRFEDELNPFDAHAWEPDVYFVNPNNMTCYLDARTIVPSVRVICSASTGLTHIDLDYCRERGIDVLHLAGDPILDRIPSTAEHAFGLMLAAVRHYPAAFEQVRSGGWDWAALPPARQLDQLTVGIVGYGRLGRMMTKYCRAFGMGVMTSNIQWDNIKLGSCDVISLHIPAAGNAGLVDAAWFARMKPTAVLVNTSRGEVVQESPLLRWLDENPQARYAADVIQNEQTKESAIWRQIQRGWPQIRREVTEQIILTPHLGGSTVDAQRLAYGRAVELLAEWKVQHENR